MLIPLLVGAAGLGMLLLFSGGGKDKAGIYIAPKAGETWTLIIRTSRPLTESDYQKWFSAVAPLAAIRSVNLAGANTYAVTMTFTNDASPMKIGGVSQLVGGTATLVNAARAPIA